MTTEQHTAPGAATPAEPGSPLPGDRLVRSSSIAVVVLVAAGAAFVSYRHAYELVRTHGESGLSALIGPATVDGMIYASGMVLLQAARYRVRPPRLAYAGLALGIVATIGANVAHGLGHGPVGALVSAWPALALIVSYELLMRLVRTGQPDQAIEAEGHLDTGPGQCPHLPGDTAANALRIAYLHGRDCLGVAPSQRHLAAAFGIDRKKVPALIASVTAADGKKEDDQEPPAVSVNGHGATNVTGGA